MMDSLFTNMDWSMAMSDKLPADYITYSEKRYREKYLLSIPFYYKADEYREMREANSRYAMDTRRDELRLQDIYNRMNYCPLGSGALAGTTYPLDRDYTAEL